ncbi:hypothetical protein TRSC58_05814 [Trypanosoma rangeli SC58]|uniref:Uncharacterized protein n=1 Tax=Trypanosoma rangeli SC58 TaxID=429131 RepID=A0A061IXB4_TRYRA|nr:hypothetical protein TRSC58_05814 [Trypanosoma rangeli SC58]
MYMPSQMGASPAATQTTNAALVATVFQRSLDNLLLTATRQRAMSPLRDAVQTTRIKGFTAEDIFHTFVLACDMLHGRRQHRPLLMQSLSDLGKMASLRMLPTSCSVVHIVCHLVQKLLGRTLGGNLNLLHGSLRSTTVWERTGMDSLSNTLLLERTVPLDAELREGSFSATPGSSEAAAMDAQPPDEELQMRILQTLMAYLSACELGNAALSDIISIIFIMYVQAAPESLVEATCAATIEERTQALLRCLRSGGDAKQVEDDSAAFTAQIQAVAYAKDVCALCSGAAPKWLKLDLQRNSFMGPPDVSVVAAATPPRRLRVLLLRTLITHFAEGERINSMHETSAFLTQLLNEDVVSVVLGRGMQLTPHAQRPPGETNLEQPEETSLVDLVSFTDEGPDAEEFSLMQQLGVVVLSKALPVMRHAMPIVLRHHVVLVKLCTEEDTGDVGENARHMAVVLTLWRKAIADHELLQQLLLLSVSSSVLLPTGLSPASLPGSTSSQRPSNRQRAPLTRRQTRASEDDAAAVLLEPFSDRDDVTAEGANGMHPFADLVTLTAELLSNIIIASEGILNLDHLKATKDRGRLAAAAAAASVVEGENLRGALFSAFSRPLQLPSALKMAQGQENGEGSSQQRVLANGTGERHPATGQAADVLSFLTMFTQSFARVVEASRLGNAMSAVRSRAADADAQAAVTALFTSLHSSLLRCFGLAAQHLQGDDVIHMILKGITHLVQTSCNLDLPAQRDSYLQIFVTRLCMPTSRPLLEGEATRTPQRKHVAEESASPAQPTGSPSLAGRGRRLPGKTTPKTHPSTASAAQHRLLEGLQDKFYVLNCVISVANSMGASLGEGWRPVASCLLLTGPLLKEVHRLLEQQQRQSQYDAVDDITLQDVSRNADRVRDALHLLFIHTALLPDGVALDGLLKSFVAETCRRPASSYLLSLRMSSECCALALLTVAACRSDASLALLRRLWCTVKGIYMHVFDPVNIVELVDACRHSDGAMETVAGVLERLVEDVAVMTAQLCLRVSSSVGEKKVEKREGLRQQRLQQGEEKGAVLGLRVCGGAVVPQQLSWYG